MSQQFTRAHVRLMMVMGISLFLGSCQPMPAQKPLHKPRTSAYHLPMPPVLVPIPQVNPTILLPQEAPPMSYVAWLNRHDYRTVERYRDFLKQHGIQSVPPMYQMLTSARDWQSCEREQYDVPPKDLWSNMLPTLKVLDRLQHMGIIEQFEVTSTYRDPELNACAKGSLGSKHVHNAALDIKLIAEDQDPVKKARTHAKLCDFWQQYGEQYQLGLGLYGSGQIHIDTEGYRTWGPDHTRQTSICANQYLAKK